MRKNFSIIAFLTFILVFSQANTDTKITICWDTSFSMLERDIEKEFEILDKILHRSPELSVQLILFNTAIEERFFEISDGNWNELKEVLTHNRADGGTIYNGLSETIKNDQVYFFSDGNGLLPNVILPVKKGNVIINTVPTRNVEVLKKSALIGNGRLMDFAAMLPKNRESTVNDPPLEKTIKGKVYIDNVPQTDIEIRVTGSQEIYKTDATGAFTIPSIPGDSILISSRSFKTMKKIPIGYFSDNLEVFLNSNITALEEVIVSENRVESTSKDMVETGTGLKNKEGIGYAVQSIGSEEITPIQTDLNQSVQGRFSNVNLSRDQDLTQFKGRSNNTLLGNTYGLVVVDGIPIQQSDSSSGYAADASFIDPNNVAEITVLKGLAATNRYGSLGNAGVILITTKNALKSKGAGGSVNSALVQNNIYDAKSKIVHRESAIIKTLKNAQNVETAYNKYLELRNFNLDNESFFLDSFEFFKDKDANVATRIISNLLELNPKDIHYLKLVELSSRGLNELELANYLNKAIYTADPTALQPFFTEAQIYFEKGEYQKALDAWATLAKGGAYGTMQVDAIKKSLNREIKNLVFQKRTLLNVTKLDDIYFNNEKVNVRLRLEWSNPKAEFQIQFVNPQNRYFNWEHTSMEDTNRIANEVNLGFAMEEFEVYDDLKGLWQININYLGNLDKANTDPLVLLCTVYTDFGYPSQSREVIWLYVDQQNSRKEIVSFKN